MALKKSQLYSSLWQSCDELRGGMDASQYKDYVLVLLFIKYVSDKYAGVPYAPITIPPGSSFKDMVALKGKPDIGDQLNKKIIGPLANANKLSDMPDFNEPSKLGSGKEMVERLTNLIAIFESKALDFSKNRAAFIACMNTHFAAWRQESAKRLRKLEPGFHPKQMIADLSEDLLAHYTGQPLIDKYDVYQHLMDYWAETMQDDCYFIAADGWKAETYRVIEKDKKGNEKDKGWACDLVPKSLIVARYFAKEQAASDQLASELEGVTARITELEEEHGGEDEAFAENADTRADAVEGKIGKVTVARVRDRINEIKDDKDAKDEAAVLNDWLTFNGEETDLKKRIKEEEAALDAQAYAKYSKLTEFETKTLVVDDKWLAALDAAIHGEMDRISQALTQRVKELAETL